ncbi:related to sucrose transporter SUT1D [Cephalotrichum gorgonifer]|uniref:Related to sucrose transporter SUT1D n=1 Tax=Cephalotrichum gorgonifer TaxID=2041049 RepID=A0AAE8MXF2_9PEZI|nr:related to sucrose transporter SUT1D [Cephalotrichum gorgonifer]
MSAVAEKTMAQRGQASVKGSTESMRMILLAFAAIGITFTWGFEMTCLTKSGTSLVWIAGPVSGLIVQPIIGTIADKSTSRFGRRRPFMVAGSVIVATNLLLLGFTREFVGLFLEGEAAAKATIWLAVLSIWVIDFAINASMSCSRSLVVDILPIHKQQTGASWYSRLAASGNVLGYSIGSLDLVSMFGSTFGDTQFKKLALIAAFTILFTCGVTCWAVTERVIEPRKGEDGRPQEEGVATAVRTAVRTILATLRNLPPRVEGICWAHFWSWIGWFPFNFYGTTWVGETYFRYDLPAEQRNSKDVLSQIGRIGSTSLVIYSSITLASSFFLPLLVRGPKDMDFTPRPPRAIAGIVRRLGDLKPDLLTAWMCGHLGFSAAMLMAPFARSYKFATFLQAMCGVPWAMTAWAPPTFLGIEVNRLSGGSNSLPSHKSPAAATEKRSPSPSRSMLSPESASSPPESTDGELSGIYFGILNIYSTIPQFMGAVMSGTVFYLFDAEKGPGLEGGEGIAVAAAAEQQGPNPISVCLFIGALCALVSAYRTRKLKYIPS